MTVHIYNTMTRKVEQFVPLEKGKVGLYTCGPTVYNYAHIGNLRTFIFEDILKRVLLNAGFKVNHVMNITDVGHLTSDADEGEDKMDKGAKREGKTVWEVAEFYTEAFLDDAQKLNILLPSVLCKATEHIKEQIALIEKLEKEGFTYETDEEVYFDTSKFEKYGKLARLNIEQLKAGARVEVGEHKRNPTDFALWKKRVGKNANHTMHWKSPWGDGFPGWHIECSAMAMKYLGETFDIHCGGIDHIPVHHTNEIAQSEAATGKAFVRFWMHGEFLNLSNAKMAKSGENFITLKTLEEKDVDPLDYRYFLLGAHYRQQMNFSWEALENARHTFSKLKDRVAEIINNADQDVEIGEKAQAYKDQFEKEIRQDLGVPQALAVLWEVVKDQEISDGEKLELVKQFDTVFGLNLELVTEDTVPETIAKLVQDREDARAAKKFDVADKLRKKIEKSGFEVRDSSEGPIVKKSK